MRKERCTSNIMRQSPWQGTPRTVITITPITSHQMIPSSQERLDTVRICPQQQQQQQQQQQTIAIEYFQKKEQLNNLAQQQVKEQLKQQQEQQQYEQLKRYHGQSNQLQHFQQNQQSPQQQIKFKQMEQTNNQGRYGINHRHAVSVSTVINTSSMSPHTPSPRVVYQDNRRMNQHDMSSGMQQQQQYSDHKKNIEIILKQRNSQEEIKQFQQSCFQGRSQLNVSGLPLQTSSPLVGRRNQQLSTSVQYFPISQQFIQQTPQLRTSFNQQRYHQNQQQISINDQENNNKSINIPNHNVRKDNINNSFQGQIQSLSPITTRRQIMPVSSFNRSPQTQNQCYKVDSSAERIQQKSTCILPVSFSELKQNSLLPNGNKVQQISYQQDQLRNQHAQEQRQGENFIMLTPRKDNQMNQGETYQKQQQQQQKIIIVPPLSLVKNGQKIPLMRNVTEATAPVGERGTNCEVLFSRRSQSLACDPFVCLSERSKIFNPHKEKINMTKATMVSNDNCISPLTERPSTQYQQQQDQKALTERGLIIAQRQEPKNEKAGKLSQLIEYQQRIGNVSVDMIDKEENNWRQRQAKKRDIEIMATPPRESLEIEVNTFRQLLHIHDGKEQKGGQQQQKSQENEDATKTMNAVKNLGKENEQQSATDRLEVIQTQIKQLKGQLLKKAATKDRSISVAVIDRQYNEILTLRNPRNQENSTQLNGEIKKQQVQQLQQQQINNQHKHVNSKHEQQQAQVTGIKNNQSISKEEVDTQYQEQLDGWFSDSESESGSEDTRISAFERQVACQDFLLKQGIQNAYDLRDSLLVQVKNNIGLVGQQKLERKLQEQTQRIQQQQQSEKTNNNKVKQEKQIKNQKDISIAKQNPIPCTFSETNAQKTANPRQNLNSLSDFDDCFTEFSLSSCTNVDISKQQQLQQPSQLSYSFAESSTEFDILESQLTNLPMNNLCIMLTNYLDTLATKQKHLQQAEKIIKSQLLLLSSEESHEQQLQQQSTLVQFLIKDISAKLNYIELLKSQLLSYLRSAKGGSSSYINNNNKTNNTDTHRNHSVNKEDLIKHAVKYSGLISKAINRIDSAINKLKQAANLKDIVFSGGIQQKHQESQRQQQSLQYHPTRDRNH